MGRCFLIIKLFLLVLGENFKAEENLALPCAGCHGTNGLSHSNSTIPKIAGLETEYFVQAFNEYKDDVRENYIMRIIAKGYSEKEIIEMSKFFKDLDNDK
tara:strand:- start:386 stop:685 length:300 start_codon:yes stop_codon:yes gene_type:complete